jgi:hypothetical protein
MKNILCSIFVLLVCFLIPFSALAADRDVGLFSATSDAFTGSLQLDAEVNDSADVDSFGYNEIGTAKAINLTDLKNGFVLYQSSGKNVATLSSDNFNAATGGTLTITYLQDGVSGTYQTFECEMIRQGQAWKMMAADDSGNEKAFTSLYLQSNKLFGKVIGIKSITAQ